MIKILHRYIIREALGYFLICLFAFTSILLTLRVLKFASLIINKGVQASQVAMVFLSIIPTFLEVALPMATLLGLMLAFARLSGDSEIVVMRSSGVSIFKLILPTVYFGLFATALSLIVSLNLSPWGYQTFQDTLSDIARSKTTAGLDPGVFNMLGKITLYTEGIDYQTGNLERTLIDDKRQENERQIIVATHGAIRSEAKSEALLIQLYDGAIHEHLNEKYSITRFDSNFIRIDINELFESNKDKKIKKMRQVSTPLLNQYIHQVQTYLTSLEKFGESPVSPPEELKREDTPERWAKTLIEMKIELARRIAMPFSALILALMALPLGIQPPRMQKTWGAALSLTMGLLIFSFYFAAQTIFTALGDKGIMPPILCAWMPNLSIALLACYCLRQTGTERWQSIAHGIENIAFRIKRIFVKDQV